MGITVFIEFCLDYKKKMTSAATVTQQLSSLDIKDTNNVSPNDIIYKQYESELQLPAMTSLISKDLSEPYSIYTYRYFLNLWPDLSYLAYYNDEIIGVIICKLDNVNQTTYYDPENNQDASTGKNLTIEQTLEKNMVKKGYIGMLAVNDKYRRLGIATTLVEKAIDAMINNYNIKEVMLETEITNRSALNLYGNLGFIRDERLYRYYLNGQDALRLTLYLD